MTISDTKDGAFFTFLSPSLRKLYKSATELKNDYLSADEIEKYIDLKDLTFFEENITLALHKFLIHTTSDENIRLISSEKISNVDDIFYAKALESLCPIFYACHLAFCSSHRFTTNGNGGFDIGTRYLHRDNDEYIEWVSENKAILGKYIREIFIKCENSNFFSQMNYHSIS